MIDYDKFRASTIKLYGKKNFKVTNSYRIKHIWRWYKKNKWLGSQTVTEKEFGTIVRTMHIHIVKHLLKGHDVKLPHRMGKLELRKRMTSIEYKNGVLRDNLPINWSETLKIWHQDKIARKRKQLIKIETESVYRIRYNKSKANYNNKAFYQLQFHRDVKKILKDCVKNNNIDAFLMW